MYTTGLETTSFCFSCMTEVMLDSGTQYQIQRRVNKGRVRWMERGTLEDFSPMDPSDSRIVEFMYKQFLAELILA